MCDYCVNPINLGDVNDFSLVFYVDSKPMTWCGLCPEGSKSYFQDFDTQSLITLIERTEHELAASPPNRSTDSIEAFTKKTWMDDELWRGRQELVYRVAEG